MSSFLQRIPEIPQGKGPQAYKDLLWFLWYVMRAAKARAVLICSVFILAPLSTAGYLFFMKGLVDALTQQRAQPALWMFVGLATVFLMRALIEVSRQYVQDTFRLELDLRVKEDVMMVLHGLDPATLEHPKFQTYYHALDQERGYLLAVFQECYWMIFRLLQLFGALTVIFLLPWWVIAVILLCVIPTIIAQRREKEWAWTILNMESREGRRGIYYKDVLVESRWLASRWVLGLHGLFFKRWQDIIYRALERLRRQTALRFRGQLLMQLMTITGFSLGGGTLAYRALQTGSVGTLVAFFPAYDEFSSIVTNVIHTFAWVKTRLAGVQLYRGFHEFPRRVDGTKTLSKKPLEIVFDHVSFAYPDQAEPVLKDVSVSLREGEYVALVGLNGAGKSTFLKLLAGIYRPTSGRILVSGIDLADIRSDQWVKALGYMTQNVPDFDDTVREQVKYGDPKHAWSVRGDQALDTSGFAEIAKELPKGIDTHIGRGYGMPEDNPVELSGGQRQLLMIAQTLYRRARLFIFDEPTSAVDAEKEESFFRKLPEAVQGKLCIIVSHRFSVLRRARRVLVMEAGRIIEDGSHDELIERQGKYAELFTLQAKMYQ